MLPSISRSAAASDIAEFRKTLSRSLCLIFILTIPSSLTLIVLSKPLIGAIYQGGRFSPYDTQQTALALSCYATGLVASLFSVAINIWLPALLVNYFHAGIAALALTTAFAATVECCRLFELLRRRLGEINGKYLLDRLGRVGCASLLMGLLIALFYEGLDWIVKGSRRGYFAELAMCLPAGLLAFWYSFRLLRVGELALASEILAGPLRRAISSLHARIRV